MMSSELQQRLYDLLYDGGIDNIQVLTVKGKELLVKDIVFTSRSSADITELFIDIVVEVENEKG